MGANIVIVGAGYAGILTAKKLAKKLKKEQDVNIKIIDRNPFNTMLTELHEVAAGRVEEKSIRMDLKRIFARRKVDVVLDCVTKLDFENKVVIGENGRYDYDYVVIATGSKPTYFGIEGAKENTHTLWSYQDAVDLRDHIEKTFLAASREADLAKRRHLLTFYVVGAGFTGVEMMGELAEYVPVLCDRFEISQEDVTLVEVDALDRTVPVLPEKLSAKVERRLKKMNVEVQLGAKVKKITEDSITLEIKGQDVVRPVHTVIWTAGIESSNLATTSGKELDAGQKGGRIETDQYLRALNRDDVYVVGDNIYLVLEGETAPVPQMVENAEHSAGTAAVNITKSIKGDKELEVYKPSFHGMMVCIGGRYGVAHVGFGNFFFSLPSFFAMFAKHMINCVYFVQVLGWNKVFSYAKHEFFTIRNRRSFVGGMFSNRTPSFVVFPLRVWLGFVWAFEAVKKYGEGWLDFSAGPKLKTFFGYADAFFENILNPGTNSGATGDASSGATGATSGATGDGGGTAELGQALINFRFFDIFHIILVSAVPVTEKITLGDFAFKLNVPLMNWFLNTFILSSDGMQFFMQAFIVILELLIGLALIAGLFTTISAGASVVLQIMFVMTTGWYLDTAWMFFAGIACLFAGQTFGLDYWFTPWLKKQWKKLPFIKKWYLYND